MTDASSKASLVAACAILLLVAALVRAQSPPPTAPIRPVTDDYFGTKVVDDYRYFENLKDPEVQQWMKAQANYFSVDSHTHLAIHGYRPSPDGHYIAYQLAAGGSEEPTLHVYDARAGKDLPESADRADAPNWRPDNRSFFYARRQEWTENMPAADRYKNARVYLHVLGRSFDDDPPVLGRGVSDAAIPLAPDEQPDIVTAPGSRYAIAAISPGTDPRLRVYVAPITSPWIPAKFAARLQAATASGSPVLLSVDYDAGHGGMGGLTSRQVDALRADELGFELWQTGDPAFQPGVQGVGAPRSAQPPAGTAAVHAWMNTKLSAQARARLLVQAMTLDQKIAQLRGERGPVPELPQCGARVGRHVAGIPELAIPTFRVTNGPVGVGGGDCSPQDPATALPIALGMAASFDPALARRYGGVIADETLALGQDELEGPGMDLARVGQNGRNFEYLGEDPYLAGVMASAEIQAVQAKGVIAMAKHFVLNDQETHRLGVNVQANDRTMRELYLLPFEMSVKDGKVASIMCSYNRVNGPYACDDPHILTDILRRQWGFDGYVQSDFGATHSTAVSLKAGEDFEMNSPIWYTADKIKAALNDGSLKEATIDQALVRRYTEMFRFGVFDRPIVRKPIDVQAGANAAREIAEQSAVLLKNQGVLPLDGKALRNIVVIGQAVYAGAAVTGGGGSSRVVPAITINPLDGLHQVLRQLGSGAQARLITVPDAPTAADLEAAATAAKSADAVIVMAGVVTSEGTDRPSLALPGDQDSIIQAVAAARNPRTVVVMKDADPVLMPWADQIPAILEAWNPGESDGLAVARLVFGLADPQGRLPVSYPRLASDVPTAAPDRYPGTAPPNPVVDYGEGLQMGYRWYDAQNVKPLFPFGYGLSYTRFDYGPLHVVQARVARGAPVRVTFTVTNAGTRGGVDTPQIYVTFPAAAGEPPKRLVGFDKVSLAPGTSATVSVTIDPNSTNHPLSVWDTAKQAWTQVPGALQFSLGHSSGDIASHASVTVR